MNVVIRIAITILFCIPLIISIPASAAERIKKMEALYDLSKTQTLKPEVFKVAEEATHVFPVLLNGTQYAATNSWNNAISLMKFKDGHIKVEEYFRNAYNDVDGSPDVIPPIEDGVFGFGQTRGFTIFDIKKKNFKDIRICPSINDTIAKIAIADATKRHFIFWIEKYPHNPKSAWDTSYVTKLIELNGTTPKVIKEIEMGKGYLWNYEAGKLFLFGPNNEMKVLTSQFETSQHPLENVIKKFKSKIDLSRIAIHPTLPFALITDGKKPGYLLSWGDRINLNLKHIDINSGYYFDFSPDGKWVVFEGAKDVFVMPVSEKYPYYVGTPIKLISYEFRKYASTWTTNPISFVGVNMKGVHRWELTKEAQKSMMGSDFDKYPTFHDWIVAKDMEKLTKEKKQGLGK